MPGGSVVKDTPASAGDTGWIPQSRRTPHAAEQRGLYAQLPSPRAAGAAVCEPSSPRSTTREATSVRGPHTATGGWPSLATTREGPASNGDPAQPGIK